MRLSTPSVRPKSLVGYSTPALTNAAGGLVPKVRLGSAELPGRVQFREVERASVPKHTPGFWENRAAPLHVLQHQRHHDGVITTASKRPASNGHGSVTSSVCSVTESGVGHSRARASHVKHLRLFVAPWIDAQKRRNLPARLPR